MAKKKELDFREIKDRQEFAGGAVMSILLFPMFFGLLVITEYCEKGNISVDKGTVLFFAMFLIPLTPFLVRFIWYSAKRHERSGKWWPLW
jgi:predicted CDP-diglyceride synthetase/phosphatidate cytidylyltransferase